MVDIYLRAVPSDADRDDIRLYDPTTPDAGGGTNFPVSLTFSATGTVDLVKNVGVNRSFAGTGSLALQKAIAAARAFSGTGSVTLTKNVGKFFTYSATGALALTKAIGKPLTFTATGTPALVRAIAKFLNYTGTGSVALGIVVTPAGGTNTPVGLNFSAVGSVTLQLLKTSGELPKLADSTSRLWRPFDMSHIRQAQQRRVESIEIRGPITTPELDGAIDDLEAYLDALLELLAAHDDEVLRANQLAAQLALALALEQRRRLRNNLAAIQITLLEYF